MAQNSNYVTVDGEFDSLEKRSFLTIDDYNLENQTIILRIDIKQLMKLFKGAVYSLQKEW